MKNLEPKQFVVTILQDEDSSKISRFGVIEALENYLTRTTGQKAGLDFFVRAVESSESQKF